MMELAASNPVAAAFIGLAIVVTVLVIVLDRITRGSKDGIK